MTGAPYIRRPWDSKLKPCPTAGEGVNNWLFATAGALHRQGVSPNDIHAFLRDGTTGCGRHVSDAEIRRNIERSGNGQRSSFVSKPCWAEYNQERVERITNAPDAMTLYDLWETSPIRLGEGCTEAIIDLLFKGNPLLCCGWDKATFATKPREEWRGRLGGLPLIVPSPMSARTGMTQEGTISAHSLDNTGPRRYLVVEIDRNDLSQDQQAALVWHLAGMAPLVMVLHSGGKSLHAWFSCKGASESVMFRLMRYAVTIGGDRAGWTRSQFERMPDGTRIDKEPGTARQTVYYFNPEVLR